MYQTPIVLTTTVARLAFGNDSGTDRGHSFVHLYNEGPATAYISYDNTPSTAVTSANGWPLEVGEKLFINNDGGGRSPFKFAIWGLTAAGTTTIRCQGTSV